MGSVAASWDDHPKCPVFNKHQFKSISPGCGLSSLLPSTTGGPMYRQGATVMKGSIPVSKHRLQRIGTRTNEDLLAEHSKVGIRLKSNDL